MSSGDVNSIMKPTIIEHESLKFVGLKTCIRSDFKAPNDMTRVPLLWKDIALLTANLANRLSQERFVLITGDMPTGKSKEAHYHALVPVKDFSEVPAPLIQFEIPKGRLAKFRHKGSPQNVGQTALIVLRQWLPRSNEILANTSEMMIYPADFDRNDPEAEFDYCVFLGQEGVEESSDS